MNLDLTTDFPPLSAQPLTSKKIELSPQKASIWTVLRMSSSPNEKSVAVMKSSSKLDCVTDPLEVQTPLLPQAMNGSNSAHSETSSPPLPADLETGLGKDGGFQNVDTKGEPDIIQPANFDKSSEAIINSVENIINNNLNSLEDDDKDGGFTFGFDVNQELLSMTFVNKDVQRSVMLLEQQQFNQHYEQQQRQFEEQQYYDHQLQMEQARCQFEEQKQFERDHHQEMYHQQRQLEHHQQLELVRQHLEQQQLERQQQFEQFQSQELENQQLPVAVTSDPAKILTLNQEDNAIISFGKRIDDPKVMSSPESGIYICPGTLPDSDRSTPQINDSGASSWTFQTDDEIEITTPTEPFNTKFNLEEVTKYVSFEWKKIDDQLKKGSTKIRYYRKSSKL